MDHFNYLKYVIRHKWFVFLACRKFKVSLWQSIIHDWTKFLPCEWFPYVHTFYDDEGQKRYLETASFNEAWNHHQKYNKHHWQYWILNMDSGGEEILEIPEKFAREMVADWAGAGKAITGHWEYEDWYEKNKDRMKLHPRTRMFVEHIIATEGP